MVLRTVVVMQVDDSCREAEEPEQQNRVQLKVVGASLRMAACSAMLTRTDRCDLLKRTAAEMTVGSMAR